MLNDILSVFSSIPTLETDRLILRKIKPCDIDDMYEYSSDEKVTKYLTWTPHENKNKTKKYVSFLQSLYRSGKFYDWGIILKNENKFIGTCGFSEIDAQNNTAQVGYVLNSSYWGRQIAPEALKRVLRFGFDIMRFERIEARHIDGNINSGRVMRKCGMQFEGTLRHAMYIKGEYKTIQLYSILREEWEKLDYML